METNVKDDGVRYRDFPPLGRPLSVLVLGTLQFRETDMATVEELMGAWLEAGGNVVDCAHEYGGGSSERAVGAWLAAHGRRDEVVFVSKGCHPYDGRRRVTPHDLTADLKESVARLRTTYVDLYLLHRDDPGVPVRPVLSALSEHRRAGRIGAYGASNWSTDRLDQALEASHSDDIDGFAASSPHLSLAVQAHPPYPGAVSACDPGSRSWYRRRQLPVFAWSAQAGGFFVDPPRAVGAAGHYVGAGNTERRRRAGALASSKGCEANHVALAWVLHQPFPTFATIGPRTADELRSSLRALDVDLTEEEVRWLNLEAGP